MASVLVVDDEEGIRSFLAEALEGDGHVVEQATNAEDALRTLSKRGFDVLLTDLKMDGMGGMELLRRTREEQPETECIVLTAHGSVDSAVQAMKLGAFDYLEKPLSSPDQLRLLVARALERRRLVAFKQAQAVPPARIVLCWSAPAMKPVVNALEKVAPTAATVLLLGESGTGKEVAARFVHELSPRRDGPFIAVNCAALSDSLLESELFGHEKGAFTGAHAQRRGRLELAEGGTFFLDEIGELKLDLQAKLLRVLEERGFERVGGSRTLRCDVRWVAATHRDLKKMVAEQTFRADLYYRLAVFSVELVPLRDRKEDLQPLAEALLAQIAHELGHARLTLTREALELLGRAEWPGNVRELRNALERAAILCDGVQIRAEDVQLETVLDPHPPGPLPVGKLEELEIAAIKGALAEFSGNRRKAAERLGIGLRTLYEKLKRYRLA
jgi:two-component system response regulator AtoC